MSETFVQISTAELNQQRELLKLFDQVWNAPDIGAAVRKKAIDDRVAQLAAADRTFKAQQAAELAAQKEEAKALDARIQQLYLAEQAQDALNRKEAEAKQRRSDGQDSLMSSLIAGGRGEFSAGLNDLIGKFELGAAAATGFGVAMLELTRETANYGAEVDLAARKTGESVKSYQELKYAADQTNTPIATLDQGLRRLQTTAGEAASGNKASMKIFHRLGLSPTDASGALKSADELLDGVSARLKTIGSDTEKIDLIGKLFGTRSGAQLLPILENLSKYRSDADKGIMSDKDVATALAFNQSMKALVFTLTSFRNELGTALMPVLSEVIGGFKDWLETNRKLIDFKIHTFAAELTKDLERVGEAIKGVNATVQMIGGWKVVFVGFAAAVTAFVAGGVMIDLAQMVYGAGMAFMALIPIIEATTAAIAGMNLALAPEEAVAALLGLGAGLEVSAIVGPWLALAAAATTAYLVLEDIYGFFVGWDSLLGRFTARLETSTNPTLRALGFLLVAVKEEVDSIAASPFWDNLLNQFTKDLKGLVDELKRAIPVIQQFATLMLGPALGLTTFALNGVGANLQTSAAYQRQNNATSHQSSSATTIQVGGITIHAAGMSHQQVTAAVHDAIFGHTRDSLNEQGGR